MGGAARWTLEKLVEGGKHQRSERPGGGKTSAKAVCTEQAGQGRMAALEKVMFSLEKVRWALRLASVPERATLTLAGRGQRP